MPTILFIQFLGFLPKNWSILANISKKLTFKMIFIYKISTTKHTKYPTKEILCVQCRPLRLLKFFDGLRSWGNKKRERPNKMGWKKTLTTGLEQKAYTDRSLQNSTVWFYQELAHRVGEKNYNKYLKACKYSNFWLERKFGFVDLT